MIEGFFIEVFFPGHTYKNRGRLGAVDVSKNTLVCPHFDLFKIPELLEVMVIAYKKNLEGKVRPGL